MKIYIKDNQILNEAGGALIQTTASPAPSSLCGSSLSAYGFLGAAFNGLYTETGTYEEKMYWTNPNGKFLHWTDSGDYWVMASSLGGLPIYAARGDPICPYGANCTLWETWPGGSEAGTVCINS